jgi:hypothetical protein
MFALETFENGKWSPVLKSNKRGWLETVLTKMEDSGFKCRIV